MNDGPAQEWPDIAGRLVGNTHLLGVRVYYEDTDFSGIVYHANYLRYAERGRSDFLRLAGVSHTELFDGEAPLAFAIHRMEIDFVRPARIDDLLEVRTQYRRASGARLEVRQSIWRIGGADSPDLERPDLERQELWRADVFAACLDGDGRPRRLPDGVKAALSSFIEANSG